jgi:hypothetical protein
MRLTSAQLAALVDGMDWLRLHTRCYAADRNVARAVTYWIRTQVIRHNRVRIWFNHMHADTLFQMISMPCGLWWASYRASAMRPLRKADGWPSRTTDWQVATGGFDLLVKDLEGNAGLLRAAQLICGADEQTELVRHHAGLWVAGNPTSNRIDRKREA